MEHNSQIQLAPCIPRCSARLSSFATCQNYTEEKILWANKISSPLIHNFFENPISLIQDKKGECVVFEIIINKGFRAMRWPRHWVGKTIKILTLRRGELRYVFIGILCTREYFNDIVLARLKKKKHPHFLDQHREQIISSRSDKTGKHFFQLADEHEKRVTDRLGLRDRNSWGSFNSCFVVYSIFTYTILTKNNRF